MNRKNISLLKNSFLDYPHEIAIVLFFKGCNMRCPFCQNKELVPFGEADELKSFLDIRDFLKTRVKDIPHIVLSGGEAILNRNLIQIIEELKNMGYKIKLDYNGTNPVLLKKIAPQVDYIAMDLKSAEHLALTHHSMDLVQTSFDILQEQSVPYEVRSVISEHFYGYSQVEMYLPLVQNSTAIHWRLLPFRPGNCLNDEYNNYPKCNSEFLEKIQQYLFEKGYQHVIIS